jgi:hypothetical protein
MLAVLGVLAVLLAGVLVAREIMIHSEGDRHVQTILAGEGGVARS